MKLSDTIITMILKKGFLYEAVNADMEFEIPMSAFADAEHETVNNVRVKFKADRMSLKIDRSES